MLKMGNVMVSRIAVFGDISANGVDGSSIWMQSICNLLESEHHSVYLILRDKPVENSIIKGLNDNVTVINPWDQDLTNIGSESTISSYELFLLLDNLDKSSGLDHIIVRAPRYLKEFHQKINNPSYKRVLSKIDAYFAKISIFKDDYDVTIVSKIKSNINRLIVQTEQMRSYTEQRFPELVGRIIVLNPMIPEIFLQDDIVLREKIKYKSSIYAGKIDKNYLVEEYIDFAEKFREMGYEVRLIGSKFNTVKTDKDFKSRVEGKINKNIIEWNKILTRKQTMDMVASSTFLISIRSSAFDADNEISTKLLESIASGTLPIINKNNVNVSIVGKNYPLFANNYDEVTKAISEFSLSFNNYKKVLKELQQRVQKFTFKSIYNENLRHFYSASLVNKSSLHKKFTQPTNVLVASHDNKFLVSILEKLTNIDNINFKFDNWSSTLKHDLKNSKALLEWADVIICEWAVGPAVFYSNNKKTNQKLLIRLHRFEITTEQPAKIDFEKVDRMIVVSDYIKDFCINNYFWKEDKISVIPQFSDIHHFDREKIDGYKFNLGLLGFIPKLKRLDRCLDILEDLRRFDDRYTLYIKSKMPWDVPFIWNKESEKEYYIEQFRRIENSELLRNAVIFDNYGNDVAAWFRKIGWILSTSDTEGCHTAVAEALSSGCQAVIFDWPGSDRVYSNNEIFSSPKDAARNILKNKTFDEKFIDSQKKYAYQKFDISKTVNFYLDFIFSYKYMNIKNVESDK